MRGAVVALAELRARAVEASGPVAQVRADLAAEAEALRRIDRNLRCLADDLDLLGLADRADFAQDLAAQARKVAAALAR